MNEQDRISFVLEEVEKVLPGIRENFEGSVSKCWDEDEGARGLLMVQAGPDGGVLATCCTSRGASIFCW